MLTSFFIVAFNIGEVSAAVITFEGFDNQVFKNPIKLLGFNIGNPIGQEQHFHLRDSVPTRVVPSNGTGVLVNDRSTELFIENALGKEFIFNSVDMSGFDGFIPNMRIEGFKDNVSTGTINFSTGGMGYTTVFGHTLGTVDRLIFNVNGKSSDFFVLDNLNVTIVPVPAAVWLFTTGIITLLSIRRKQ